MSADVPEEVRAYVANASNDARPLIYLGFGSMPAPEPLRLIQMAADVCRLAQCRAIVIAGTHSCIRLFFVSDVLPSFPSCLDLIASIFLNLTGWSNLSDAACQSVIQQQRASNTMLVVPAVPHDWLFPLVRCIVHHCGVGTLAAALRSGVPQVPCPFMLDQVLLFMLQPCHVGSSSPFGFHRVPPHTYTSAAQR